MRALKLLIFVAAVAFAIHWWRGRAARVEAATTSPNGFVSVIMPDGARKDTVIIFAPLNCSSDVALRADNMAAELNYRRIPNVRSNAYNASVTNPTPEQKADLQRTQEVMNGRPPCVFLNGKAKANPTVKEVIAEYTGVPQ